MLPIKFRAWCELDKVMVYDLNSPRLHHGELKDEIYEFMQFTGLHDRNGKEIYQGDIFKRPYSYDELYLVDDVMNLGFYVYEFGWESNDIEVIGNIHENQELLESK